MHQKDRHRVLYRPKGWHRMSDPPPLLQDHHRRALVYLDQDELGPGNCWEAVAWSMTAGHDFGTDESREALAVIERHQQRHRPPEPVVYLPDTHDTCPECGATLQPLGDTP